MKTSPYHVVFGQNMVTRGSTYALLQRLNALPDATLQVCSQDKLAVLRAEVQGRILQARETQERGYNLRSRAREFQVGDIVYKRLFNLSSAAKRYNAKLDQKFVKVKVIGRVGTVQYELEDMEGRNLGALTRRTLRPNSSLDLWLPFLVSTKYSSAYQQRLPHWSSAVFPRAGLGNPAAL